MYWVDHCMENILDTVIRRCCAMCGKRGTYNARYVCFPCIFKHSSECSIQLSFCHHSVSVSLRLYLNTSSPLSGTNLQAARKVQQSHGDWAENLRCDIPSTFRDHKTSPLSHSLHQTVIVRTWWSFESITRSCRVLSCNNLDIFPGLLKTGSLLRRIRPSWTSPSPSIWPSLLRPRCPTNTRG